MTDAKPNALEELKRAFHSWCGEGYPFIPEEARRVCDDAIVAWEKERAGWDTLVDKWDNRQDDLAKLRAAVTSVLSEIRAVEYPDDQITPAFRECFDYVADALDAALRGGT